MYCFLWNILTWNFFLEIRRCPQVLEGLPGQMGGRQPLGEGRADDLAGKAFFVSTFV